MENEPNKWRPANPVLRQFWRLIILVFGTTVLLVGLIMVVTPGPAMIFIPLGLSILAIEFVWARHLLKRIKATINSKLKKPPMDEGRMGKDGAETEGTANERE